MVGVKKKKRFGQRKLKPASAAAAAAAQSQLFKKSHINPLNKVHSSCQLAKAGRLKGPVHIFPVT